jgi:hypothetical protein
MCNRFHSPCSNPFSLCKDFLINDHHVLSGLLSWPHSSQHPESRPLARWLWSKFSQVAKTTFPHLGSGCRDRITSPRAMRAHLSCCWRMRYRAQRGVTGVTLWSHSCINHWPANPKWVRLPSQEQQKLLVVLTLVSDNTKLCFYATRCGDNLSDTRNNQYIQFLQIRKLRHRNVNHLR